MMMMMNKNRIFFYFVGYMLALCCFIAILYILLGVVITALMFITWSLPVASPFTWVIFRAIFSMAVVLLTSLVFVFSKEAKDWVDRCCGGS